MKHQSNTSLFICSILTAAMALAIWSPYQARSAEPVDAKNTMQGKMMDACNQMKAQKEKIKEDMKGQDAELTEQIAKMNSAPEDKKLGLMAAVITHMTEQRIAMDARKAKMEEEMMKHMMQHMEMGKESMAQCPMMKDMKDMEDRTSAPHKDHHEAQK